MDQANKKAKGWTKIAIIGIIVFLLFMVALLFAPGHVAGIFTAMANKAFDNVFNTYILGYIGASIIIAVAIGRLLERAGVTDGLVKLFLPIGKRLKMNPTVLIPAIYNFLGDVNAAGRITAPILQNAKATKHEKQIAIATMMQFPPSFGCFLFGISCLAFGGVNAFGVIVLAYLVPLFLLPIILRYTLFRKCEYRDVTSEIPSFTPDKSVVNTLFDGVIEGGDVLFRIIVPTTCAIFAIIAILEYAHIWPVIEKGILSLLGACNIEPTTGIFSFLVSGALSLPKLLELMQAGTAVAPGMIVSTVMYGAACVQLVLPFSQVPIIWNKGTDLTFGQAMWAALVGVIFRMIWCALIGFLIIPLFV